MSLFTPASGGPRLGVMNLQDSPALGIRGELQRSDVLTAAPEVWPIPKEVAGIKLPDSKLARDATDFTRGLSAPVVFNHLLRTYVFGELLGRAKELKFDTEL